MDTIVDLYWVNYISQNSPPCREGNRDSFEMLKMEVKQQTHSSFNLEESVQGMKDYSSSQNCLLCHWYEAATRLLYFLMDFLRSSNYWTRCMFCFMMKGIILSCGTSLSLKVKMSRYWETEEGSRLSLWVPAHPHWFKFFLASLNLCLFLLADGPTDFRV